MRAYADEIIFSALLKVVEPNWDYFVHAPLEEGVVRFETKTERALYANVVASEANWMESQTCDRFITYSQGHGKILTLFKRDLKPR